MRFTTITDDLTGAADSGSYFTARGRRLRICISGDVGLEREDGELLSINLSSRNIPGEKAQKLHRDLMGRLLEKTSGESSLGKKASADTGHIFMKKIGTGFRGNDAWELNGLLEAAKEHLVFLIDNAPDLGTFTLYGDQYCEGEILPKSLYAKDPIMPPTESYIPDILGHHSRFPIGLVDLDAVKGGRIREATEREILAGKRIVVFDAITKADTLAIIRELHPLYPAVFWTGSLGIADGLAEIFYGSWQRSVFPERELRCFGFCASAYDICKSQLAFSKERGLEVVEIDIDSLIEGDAHALKRAAAQVLEQNRQGNVMVVPKVEKYSYQPGTSKRILEAVGRLARELCRRAVFDRFVLIGGETAQVVLQTAGTAHLQLGRPLEPGVAQGQIVDGVMAGLEFALKGGSMGREDTLEKMMCRQEVEY